MPPTRHDGLSSTLGRLRAFREDVQRLHRMGAPRPLEIPFALAVEIVDALDMLEAHERELHGNVRALLSHAAGEEFSELQCPECGYGPLWTVWGAGLLTDPRVFDEEAREHRCVAE